VAARRLRNGDADADHRAEADRHPDNRYRHHGDPNAYARRDGHPDRASVAHGHAVADANSGAHAGPNTDAYANQRCHPAGGADGHPSPNRDPDTDSDTRGARAYSDADTVARHRRDRRDPRTIGVGRR